MTIGEALKEERENLGLSRYRFSKGVVDRKFYGKVEENNGVLSSCLLYTSDAADD